MRLVRLTLRCRPLPRRQRLEGVILVAVWGHFHQRNAVAIGTSNPATASTVKARVLLSSEVSEVLAQYASGEFSEQAGLVEKVFEISHTPAGGFPGYGLNPGNNGLNNHLHYRR